MNCPFSNSSLPQSVRNKELFPFSIQKKNSRHFIFVFPSVSYIAKTLSRTTDSLSLSLITDALSKVRRQLIKFLHMPPRNETLYCFIDLLLLEKIGGPIILCVLRIFQWEMLLQVHHFPRLGENNILQSAVETDT